jgi:hypothetical protein
MGATHFLMKTLPKVASEMALSVLAYNQLVVHAEGRQDNRGPWAVMADQIVITEKTSQAKEDVVPAWKRWSPFARPFARPPRCRRQSLALQGSRETSDRAKQTENDQYVEVRPLWCLPAKHIDLLPQDQIFRLQQCSDLKSEAKMPRISLSRSVIRPRAYPVRSLRLCRIEFSVHTGLGPTTFTKRCRPKVFSHPSDRKGQPI